MNWTQREMSPHAGDNTPFAAKVPASVATALRAGQGAIWNVTHVCPDIVEWPVTWLDPSRTSLTCERCGQTMAFRALGTTR